GSSTHTETNFGLQANSSWIPALAGLKEIVGSHIDGCEIEIAFDFSVFLELDCVPLSFTEEPKLVALEISKQLKLCARRASGSAFVNRETGQLPVRGQIGSCSQAQR